MPGNKKGGQKAAATNKERHGKDFYSRIGSMGGKWSGPKGFALNPERASRAGKLGGKISKRGKAKNHENKQENTNN